MIKNVQRGNTIYITEARLKTDACCEIYETYKKHIFTATLYPLESWYCSGIGGPVPLLFWLEENDVHATATLFCLSPDYILFSVHLSGESCTGVYGGLEFCIHPALRVCSLLLTSIITIGFGSRRRGTIHQVRLPVW